ncbi:MAG: hypothetical protein IKD32_03160 [Bacteroidales bacterium]|nr:hypothetical protein [Bacteroidales bacterium]
MYSYDDFGNFALRRKMNSPVISETFTYDNINTTFDRGFCMHEHYRDFGLINMNGRMYDPLVGRMLSPDIVIQNPEYSQSYNRYSYCFNNPLRFTDPSGYVVKRSIPLKQSLILVSGMMTLSKVKSFCLQLLNNPFLLR